MLNDSGYDSYQSVSLEAKAASASPQELVLMLIDGLLEGLVKIESHINAMRFSDKASATTKCINILVGLESSLNKEGDKELYSQLVSLYSFCQQQLYDASINNDVKPIKNVREVMTNLRSGWAELGKQQ